MKDDVIGGSFEEKELPLGSLDSSSETPHMTAGEAAGLLAKSMPDALGAATKEAASQVKDFALEQSGVTPPPRKEEPEVKLPIPSIPLKTQPASNTLGEATGGLSRFTQVPGLEVEQSNKPAETQVETPTTPASPVSDNQLP